MKNGGYIIVDFGGVNFEYGTPVKIDGIYNKIAGGTKPLLLSGIVLEGVAYRDRFVSPEFDGMKQVIPITEARVENSGTYNITAAWFEVTNNDMITAKDYSA